MPTNNSKKLLPLGKSLPLACGRLARSLERSVGSMRIQISSPCGRSRVKAAPQVLSLTRKKTKGNHLSDSEPAKGFSELEYWGPVLRLIHLLGWQSWHLVGGRLHFRPSKTWSNSGHQRETQGLGGKGLATCSPSGFDGPANCTLEPFSNQKSVPAAEEQLRKFVPAAEV